MMTRIKQLLCCCVVKVLMRCKEVLLQCATLDSVARLRDTSLPPAEVDWLINVYSHSQQHGSLLEFLRKQLQERNQAAVQPLFAQVSTLAWL